MKNTEKKLLGKNKYLLLGIGFLIGLGLLFYGNFGAKDKANDAESLPEMEKNTYVQAKEGMLGQYGANAEKEPEILPFTEENIQRVFGDQEAQIDIV